VVDLGLAQVAEQRLGVAQHARLTDAREAVIGVDEHVGQVAPRRPDDMRTDSGDLHKHTPACVRDFGRRSKCRPNLLVPHPGVNGLFRRYPRHRPCRTSPTAPGPTADPKKQGPNTGAGRTDGTSPRYAPLRADPRTGATIGSAAVDPRQPRRKLDGVPDRDTEPLGVLGNRRHGAVARGPQRRDVPSGAERRPDRGVADTLSEPRLTVVGLDAHLPRPYRSGTPVQHVSST